MSISVAIVEDNRKQRESLVRLFERSDFECIGAFATAELALAEIPLRPPDVLLMDLRLPKLSGAECVRKLKSRLPDLKIIMLTIYEDADSIFSALRAGANGYLLKNASKQELFEGVRAVLKGVAPVSSEIATRLVTFFNDSGKARADFRSLTDRERQVVDLLAMGLIRKEVAERLGVSVWTVDDHLKSIFHKLHVSSGLQVVVKYFQHQPRA
jgi:DNA-binding NarL/FixJ family response regulator